MVYQPILQNSFAKASTSASWAIIPCIVKRSLLLDLANLNRKFKAQ